MLSKLLLLFLGVFSLTALIHALPSRGHYPFAIALCTVADNSTQPFTPDYVNRFFTSAGAAEPGMYQFFRQNSAGAVDLEGSIVSGWHKADPSFATLATYDRLQRLNACRTAAVRDGLVIPSTHKFIAIWNTATDGGETPGTPSVIGGVVFRADYHFGIAIAAHEVLHTLGQVHSRLALQTNPPMSYCSQDEYCDQFDIMSTENLYTSYNDGVYSTSGPNLCAPGRERMGWMPMDRIYTPPVNAWKVPLRLTSLSFDVGMTSGWLMARIPIFTPNSQPHAYYTVEFRTSTGFDQGLSQLGEGQSGVVIHRVDETEQANWYLHPRFSETSFGKPFSWFHEQNDTFFDNAGGILLRVTNIDINNRFADIEITASGTPGHDFFGPNTCANGYVWRQADTLDYACVGPARRDAVQQENQLSASRTVPGSAFCVQGYVWREAWPGDHVCVTPASRSTAQDETKRQYKLVANDWGSRAIASMPMEAVIP